MLAFIDSHALYAIPLCPGEEVCVFEFLCGSVRQRVAVATLSAFREREEEEELAHHRAASS